MPLLILLACHDAVVVEALPPETDGAIQTPRAAEDGDLVLDWLDDPVLEIHSGEGASVLVLSIALDSAAGRRTTVEEREVEPNRWLLHPLVLPGELAGDAKVLVQAATYDDDGQLRDRASAPSRDLVLESGGARFELRPAVPTWDEDLGEYVVATDDFPRVHFTPTDRTLED